MSVGGAKLSAEETKKLSDIASVGAEELVQFGENTDFAENILGKAGKETELPAVEDILGGVFNLNSHVAQLQLLDNANSTQNPIKLFEFKDKVAPEYADIKKMIIHNFWGGRRFYAGEENKWNYADNCIKEIRKEYLETGDIIIWATAKDRTLTGMTSDFSVITVMVYDGEKLLSAKATDGIYNI